MGRKLTYEHVKQVFKDGGCKLLSREYVNSVTKLDYQCECGNISSILLHNFRKGQRCQKCADKQFSRRYTIGQVRKFFRDHGCVLLSNVYKDNRSNLDYICSCGSKSSIRFYNFLQGCRCKKCGGKEKLTFEYVQQYFKQNDCVLLEKEYVNAHINMRYKCSCGDISKIDFNHFSSGRRCNKCGIEKRSGKNNYGYNFSITDEERKLKRFYPKYREWRKGVYKRDDYTCQRCLQRGGRLNAHHIENYSSNKKLRTNKDNGITMCKVCHKEFHTKYGKKNNDKYQLQEFLKMGVSCLN